jgi:hypothetical protein
MLRQHDRRCDEGAKLTAQPGQNFQKAIRMRYAKLAMLGGPGMGLVAYSGVCGEGAFRKDARLRGISSNTLSGLLEFEVINWQGTL